MAKPPTVLHLCLWNISQVSLQGSETHFFFGNSQKQQVGMMASLLALQQDGHWFDSLW